MRNLALAYLDGFPHGIAWASEETLQEILINEMDHETWGLEDLDGFTYGIAWPREETLQEISINETDHERLGLQLQLNVCKDI